MLLVCGLIGGFAWYKITTLKQKVMAGLEQAIQAKIEVAGFKISFGDQELQITGIDLVNQDATAPWSKGHINQAAAHFKFSDLFSSNIPIEIEVADWNLVLCIPLSGAPASDGFSKSGSNSTPDSFRHGVWVKRITASHGEVEIDFAESRKTLLHDVNFEANNKTGDWTTNLKAESIVMGNLQTGPSSVYVQSEEKTISITNLSIQCTPGSIKGEGTISLGNDWTTSLKLHLDQVPVAMLVATQWQVKLSGLVSGDLTYQGNGQTDSAHGHIQIAQGKVNLLPFLGQLTALVNLPDIGNVELDQLESDVDWEDHDLRLIGINLQKKDTMRITGNAEVAADGQVDGKLKLGFPSTIFANFPAFSPMFPDASDGYNWTNLHVTGTADHLQEDLSPRLAAAGIQQGKGFIDQASKEATKFINGLLVK